MSQGQAGAPVRDPKPEAALGSGQAASIEELLTSYGGEEGVMAMRLPPKPESHESVSQGLGHPTAQVTVVPMGPRLNRDAKAPHPGSFQHGRQQVDEASHKRGGGRGLTIAGELQALEPFSPYGGVEAPGMEPDMHSLLELENLSNLDYIRPGFPDYGGANGDLQEFLTDMFDHSPHADAAAPLQQRAGGGDIGNFAAPHHRHERSPAHAAQTQRAGFVPRHSSPGCLQDPAQSSPSFRNPKRSCLSTHRRRASWQQADVAAEAGGEPFAVGATDRTGTGTVAMLHLPDGPEVVMSSAGEHKGSGRVRVRSSAAEEAGAREASNTTSTPQSVHGMGLALDSPSSTHGLHAEPAAAAAPSGDGFSSGTEKLPAGRTVGEGGDKGEREDREGAADGGGAGAAASRGSRRAASSRATGAGAPGEKGSPSWTDLLQQNGIELNEEAEDPQPPTRPPLPPMGRARLWPHASSWAGAMPPPALPGAAPASGHGRGNMPSLPQSSGESFETIFDVNDQNREPDRQIVQQAPAAHEAGGQPLKVSEADRSWARLNPAVVACTVSNTEDVMLMNLADKPLHPREKKPQQGVEHLQQLLVRYRGAETAEVVTHWSATRSTELNDVTHGGNHLQDGDPMEMSLAILSAPAAMALPCKPNKLFHPPFMVRVFLKFQDRLHFTCRVNAYVLCEQQIESLGHWSPTTHTLGEGFDCDHLEQLLQATGREDGSASYMHFDFEFTEMRFLSPSRMKKRWIIYTCSAPNGDVLYCWYKVPTVVVSRSVDQYNKALLILQGVKPLDGRTMRGRKEGAKSADDSGGSPSQMADRMVLRKWVYRTYAQCKLDRRPLVEADLDGLEILAGFPPLEYGPGEKYLTEQQWQSFQAWFKTTIDMLKGVSHLWFSKRPTIISGFGVDQEKITEMLSAQKPETFAIHICHSQPGCLYISRRLKDAAAMKPQDLVRRSMLRHADLKMRSLEALIRDMRGVSNMLDISTGSIIPKDHVFSKDNA